MTHTFTKTPTPHHALDKAAVTVTIESDNLSEVLAALEDYLSGCGLLEDGMALSTKREAAVIPLRSSQPETGYAFIS